MAAQWYWPPDVGALVAIPSAQQAVDTSGLHRGALHGSELAHSGEHGDTAKEREKIAVDEARGAPTAIAKRKPSMSTTIDKMDKRYRRAYLVRPKVKTLGHNGISVYELSMKGKFTSAPPPR